MHRLWLTLLVAFLSFAPAAEANPFVFGDMTLDSVGLGGGWLFGQGRLQPGFSLDIYHSQQLDRFAPDVELFAVLGWTINSHWYLLTNLGGGVSINEDSSSWSARSLFVLTGTDEIALRVSLFAQWKPENSDTFLQTRIGPSIRLGNTQHRLFPNLGLGIAIPGNGGGVSANFIPGCLLVLNL